MYRMFLILALMMGLAGLFAGCSGNNSASSDNGDSIAAEFGGYAPTDEAPAFGDPVIAEEMTGDVEYADAVAASPTLDSIVNNDAYGVYALRVVWGSLVYDPTIAVKTNWTGSLKVDDGAIVIRKIIRFEPGQDYILERVDRKLVEWVSYTTVHHDGLLAYVYDPPVTDTTAAEIAPNTITFSTAPFSITLNVDDLAALDTIVYLGDDSTNAVALRGCKIEPMACPRGFLDGRWGVDSTGQGIFYGRWMSNNGFLLGHLEGTWGPELIDNIMVPMFYGKYIDITGQFQGLIRGMYMPHPNFHAHENAFRHAAGEFLGYFYDADGNTRGVLKGRYKLPRANTDNKMGYFAGRWKSYCPRYTIENDGLDD
ncbi:MAG: hypothetical protein JW763_07725 [candidate division Zixibacteria bacterium]|nr:hypothetical protein [candidate division Zixibacteria bacterium]